MSDLRLFFKHGFAIAAAVILFQGIAAMVLMNLPPIKIYLFSSLLAVVLIGMSWLLRRSVQAKKNLQEQQSKSEQ
jgi:membrane protein implicated in regulation of membrane protease activity